MLRTGVDLVEIARVKMVIERYGERFLGRVFTLGERADVSHNIASLAARFAAKEAVSKALGTGIGKVSWQEIEVLYNESHLPQLHLHGKAAQLAKALGLSEWALSISHDQNHAIALVVAVGD